MGDPKAQPLTTRSGVQSLVRILSRPFASQVSGLPVFSYVVVAHGKVLSELEFGAERNGLAIEPAENQPVGFVAIVDSEPNPLGFARLLMRNLELDEITRVVFHHCLSATLECSCVSGAVSHNLLEPRLRYCLHEIWEVAMKVRILLKP